jgi:hypothetical protein
VEFEAPAANPYETLYINENGTTVYFMVNNGARIADGKYYTYTIEPQQQCLSPELEDFQH